MTRTLRANILVVSDSSARGERPDGTGPLLREALEARQWNVVACEVAPDDFEAIRARLAAWTDAGDCDAVVTTGGTGLAPRDVTPEATRAVIEKEIPGLAELMRVDGVKKTRRAALSRGVVGVRKGRLIVNLPGNPQGALESLESILDLLSHAVDICQGRTAHEASR